MIKKIIFILIIFTSPYFLHASVPPGIVKLTNAIFNSVSAINDVKIQSDGKIVLVGYTTAGGIVRYTIARLTSQGFLDTSIFSPNGYFQNNSGSVASSATSIALDEISSPARIIMGAMSQVSGNTRAIYTRFNISTGASLGTATSSLTSTAVGAIALTAPNTVTTAGIRIISSVNSTVAFNGALSTSSTGYACGTFGRDIKGGLVVLDANNAVYCMSVGSGTDPRSRLVSYNFNTLANITELALPSTLRLGAIADYGSGTLFYTGVNGTNTIIYRTTGGTALSSPSVLSTITSSTATAYPYSIGGGIGFEPSDTSKTNVLTCGYTNSMGTSGNNMEKPFIARVNSTTGALDTTYGTAGLATVTASSVTPGYWSSMALQPNNYAVVAGFSESSVDGGRRWMVARYDNNGVLDRTFGVNTTGVLLDTNAPFNTGVAGYIYTTTIDQEGKLIVGGQYGTQAVTLRYTTTGGRDGNTFGANGVANLTSLASSSVVQKIVTNGTNYIAAGLSNSNQWTTFKLTNVGVLDTNFNTNGIVVETGVGPSSAYSLYINGTALSVAGYTDTTKATVINYNSNTGQRDVTLGTNGIQIFKSYSPGVIYDLNVTTGSLRYGAGQDTGVAFVGGLVNEIGLLQDTAAPFNTGLAGLILTTTIDQAGKLVVAGSYGTNAQVTRYNVASSSVRDTSFNTDGVAINDLTTTAVINKIINATSNQYLVAGVSNTNQFTTALYANDGTLNSGYGSGGIVRETGVGVSQAYDMLLNGTALAVAGFINNNKAGVINYNATNGTPSSTLGDRGVQQFNTLGTAATLYGIATTTGTQRFGAGQSNSNLAFLQSLGNPVGIVQDTASPFNTGANALLYSTTINQTGDLIVGGQYDSINTTWTVASYTPAGARNISFNTNGVAVAPSGFDTGRVRAVMIDNAGRILATGTSRIGGSDENATTVRYNGAGASSTTARETGFGVSSGLGLYINSDNSFEIVGFSTTGGQETPTVFSYDANLTNINTDQFATLRPGQFYALQEVDGNFFAAGSSVDTAVLYPLLDGTGLLRDTAAPFDTGFSGRMFGGILDSDQKIVLCGNYNNVFTVIKYNLNASRNTDFNTDGVVQLPVLDVATGYAVTQDSAGNYYLAGESTVGGTLVFTLVKLSNTGELEFVVQETGLGIGRAKAVKINADGTVLVGGQTTVNGVLLPTIISYTATGQKVTTFGTNGVQIFSTYGTGSLEGLSVINIATVAAAGQTSDVATVLQFGQTNNLLNALNNGF